MVRLTIAALLALLTGCEFDSDIEAFGCWEDAACPTGAICVQPEPGVIGHCEEAPPGDDDDDDDDDTPPPDNGSLFFSEFFADTESGLGHWMEISNTSQDDVDLSGFTMQITYSDETPPAVWIIPDGVVAIGGTAILVGQSFTGAAALGTPALAAEWADALLLSDYVHAITLHKEDGTEIDRIEKAWAPHGAGASVTLDAHPDCFQADSDNPQDCWCVAPDGEWTPDIGGYGSPAAFNDDCPEPASLGSWIFTEFALSPIGDFGAEAQWIEVHNVSGQTRSLWDLELVVEGSPDRIVWEDGAAIPDGGYALLANKDIVALAGFGPEDFAVTLELPLERVDVQLRSTVATGDVLIDRVDMDGSGWDYLIDSVGDSGSHANASISLHPSNLSDGDNDFGSNWCPGAMGDVYDNQGNVGTPGAENPSCYADPGDDDDSVSDDDDTVSDDDDTVSDDDDSTGFCPPNGTYGGLVITEVYADPLDDDFGEEWFEITNSSNNAIDLACLQIQMDSPNSGLQNYEIPDSNTQPTLDTMIFPDEIRVLGQLVDFNNNGGAPVDIEYGTDLVLELGTTLTLMDDGTPIDEFVLDASEMPIVEGASISLDPGSFDALSNNEGVNWCITPAGTFGVNGGFGDPGLSNFSCPSPLSVGDLFFTEIMPAPTNLANPSDGIWVEIYNSSDSKVSLFDWHLQTNNWQHQIADPLLVEGKSFVVLTGEQNSQYNGGVTETYYTLNQPSSEIEMDAYDDAVFLRDPDLVLYDEVSWNLNVSSWAHLQSVGGQSFTLEMSGSSVTTNNDGANWCLSPEPVEYGDGGFGSPGTTNMSCPSAPVVCAGSTPVMYFTELMASPSNPNGNDQWVELYNDSGYAVDMLDYKLELTDETGATVSQALNSTQWLWPNTYGILANSPAEDLETELLPVGRWDGAFNLDGGGTLELTQISSGCLVDAIDFTTMDAWAPNPGMSHQLGPLFHNSEDNDGDTAWCLSQAGTNIWSGGDIGTPGEPNPDCGITWYDEVVFCGAAQSLYSQDPAVQAAWSAASHSETQSFMVAPLVDPSTGALLVQMAAADPTTGACGMPDEATSAMPYSSTPSGSQYELWFGDDNILPAEDREELHLAVLGDTWTIFGATVDLYFDSSTYSIQNVVITGDTECSNIGGSYCNSGNSAACPTGSDDCVEITLESGSATPVSFDISP